MRVLIVEDFGLTRSMLQAILRSDDFDVIGQAGDGLAGLDMALKRRPDIILLDHFMPNKNGIDVLPEIRANLPHAEILMVTSANEMEQVTQALTLGANDYIVKPFNTATVLEKMNKSRDRLTLAQAAQAETPDAPA